MSLALLEQALAAIRARRDEARASGLDIIGVIGSVAFTGRAITAFTSCFSSGVRSNVSILPGSCATILFSVSL